MNTPPIFCLLGPTCSGKTDLAIQLTQQFPFEIISVDSAMVYRGMDIGTAKPKAAILRDTPHHLIDICEPHETYSAAQFREDASRVICAIHQSGKIPLLVGGTMLYFFAFQHGMNEMPGQNADVRARITREADELGWDALHNRLASIDPFAASRIHPHDSQRIQRALEVFYLTGKSMSVLHSDEKIPQEKVINIILKPNDRKPLHQKIEQRFLQMLDQGFVEEVVGLRQRGDLNLNLNKPAIRSVGYRQIWQYLDGEFDYETMKEKAIVTTRQLAKRQVAWLRKWEGEENFECEDLGLFNKVCERVRRCLGTLRV